MVTITEDQLTARSVDLGELARRLQIQHTARQDVVAPARRLRMDGGQLIAELPMGDPIVSTAGISSSMALRPTDLGLGDIADKLGIPVAYLRRMRAEGATELLDHNVNEWLARQDDRRYLVRGLVGDDGTGLLRALLSGNYEIADNLDVLLAMLDGLKETGVNAVPTQCDLSARRMYVTVTSPQIAVLAPGLLRNYVSPFTGDRLRATSAAIRIARSPTASMPRAPRRGRLGRVLRAGGRLARVVLASRLDHAQIMCPALPPIHHLGRCPGPAQRPAQHPVLRPRLRTPRHPRPRWRAGSPRRRARQ